MEILAILMMCLFPGCIVAGIMLGLTEPNIFDELFDLFYGKFITKKETKKKENSKRDL